MDSVGTLNVAPNFFNLGPMTSATGWSGVPQNYYFDGSKIAYLIGYGGGENACHQVSGVGITVPARDITVPIEARVQTPEAVADNETLGNKIFRKILPKAPAGPNFGFIGRIMDQLAAFALNDIPAFLLLSGLVGAISYYIAYRVKVHRKPAKTSTQKVRLERPLIGRKANPPPVISRLLRGEFSPEKDMRELTNAAIDGHASAALILARVSRAAANESEDEHRKESAKAQALAWLFICYNLDINERRKEMLQKEWQELQTTCSEECKKQADYIYRNVKQRIDAKLAAKEPTR
jgi:hypothetical protein